MPTFGGIVVATGGQGTGRRSFIDVIDELSRPVDASDTDIRALAADAFRAAVRTMNRKGLWPWEHQDQEVTITTNQKFSTVSGAVKKPLAMHELTASGGTRKRKIWYVSYERFLEKYDLDITSEVHSYCIPNMFETGQIRWIPTPSSTTTAKFSYYRVTPAPRAEQETIEVPDHAIEPYMAYAWLEFLKRLPSESRPFPIQVALAEARLAFREISSHVASPGDRSRQISVEGYG